MKTITRIAGFSMSVAAAGVVVGGIALVVAHSIATALIPAEDPLWRDLRCWAGLPRQSDQQCIEDTLNKALREQEAAHLERMGGLELKLASLEQEKSSLEVTRASLDQRLKTLEEIESRVTSFTLFTSKPWRDVEVTTGVAYSSFVKAQEWTRAWCYVRLASKSGLPLQITLADQKSGSSVEEATQSDHVLRESGLSAADLQEARALCVFPASGGPA